MSSNQPSMLIAAALIWKDSELLLVQQQGSEDPAPTWALPGGVVGAGELLSQALAREVREETGLTITKLGPLAYVAQLLNKVAGDSSTSFIFEVSEWNGVIAPQDPDSLILNAHFMSVDHALAKLIQLPWRVMREPILAYLQGGGKPGGFWGYCSGSDDQITLVERPGNWRAVL